MQRWMHQGTTMRFNDIEGDIACCERYGFDAIELKYNLVCNHNRGQLKNLLWESGIKVGSVGALWLPVLQNKAVKRERELRLKSLCEYAGYLEADYVTVLPNREIWNVEWRDIEEDAVSILEKYSNIAKEYNVKLAMEIMGFSDCCINTIKKGLEVMNQVGKDNLGLIYDFYHSLGMEDLGAGIVNAKGNNIFIVHVNDGECCTPGLYCDDGRLWLGDGEFRLGNQIDMLRKIAYSGPFSVEVYRQEMREISVEECYKKAQDSLDRIEALLKV